MALEEMTVRLVKCDWCGVPGPFSPSADAAAAEARVLGWEQVHEVFACPVCVERGECVDSPPVTISAPASSKASLCRLVGAEGGAPC